MKELFNKITITGELVKNTIEEFKTKRDGTEAIGGSLILRTADGSEHEVRFYSNKYKKDANKNFTNEESKLYQEYLKSKDLKDIEHCAEGEKPDIVSITDGQFTANDFKGKDGNVVSTNKISARFINVVEPKDYDSTPLIAKFEVEGIIEKLEDEIIKNESTGNLVLKLNAIGQRNNGFGKNANYEADHLIPIKMIVNKDMVDAFRGAGYAEGMFVKFVGKVINTVETTKIVEKQAFGEDNIKIVKAHIVKNEITSGSEPSTYYEHDLDDAIINTLKERRKQTLLEIVNEVSKSNNVSNNSSFKVDKSTAPKITHNPFARN